MQSRGQGRSWPSTFIGASRKGQLSAAAHDMAPRSLADISMRPSLIYTHNSIALRSTRRRYSRSYQQLPSAARVSGPHGQRCAEIHSG
jgi:hypothetical protein